MIIAKDARESAFGVALEKLLKIYPDPQENEVNVGNFSQARESTNLTFQRDRGKIPSYICIIFLRYCMNSFEEKRQDVIKIKH
jgi:hypothetical protein